FSYSCAAVVEGSIGDFHARQLRHVGLKLEDCLQRALRDLRLIWRVCSVKLRVRDQSIDPERQIMMIDSRAKKRRRRSGILRRPLLEVIEKLRFCEGFR